MRSPLTMEFLHHLAMLSTLVGCPYVPRLPFRRMAVEVRHDRLGDYFGDRLIRVKDMHAGSLLRLHCATCAALPNLLRKEDRLKICSAVCSKFHDARSPLENCE
jgi:hypothetical protein